MRKGRERKRSKISLKIIIIIIIIVTVIATGIYFFYRFYWNREQKMMENGWVNMELHYIGSAKTDYMKNHWDVIDDFWLRKDGELTYVYPTGDKSYEFWRDYDDYQLYNQRYEYYDMDFDPQETFVEGENVYYVISYLRRLEWLQYNPNEISQFGGVLNRAGKEWDAEIEDDKVYFYKIEYSGGHHLADVSMEF